MGGGGVGKEAMSGGGGAGRGDEWGGRGWERFSLVYLYEPEK